MATITGSISPTSKTSDNSNGQLTITFTGVSQDDETNQSVISYKIKGLSSSGYWLYGYGWYWSYDNVNWTKITEFTTTSDSSVVKQSAYSSDTWKTGTFTIPHDDNGERTFYFKLKHLFRYGANSTRWAIEDGSSNGAKATVFECTLSTIPLQTIRILINGEWKKAFPYIRINGEWQKSKAFIRVNGEWKKGK